MTRLRKGGRLLPRKKAVPKLKKIKYALLLLRKGEKSLPKLLPLFKELKDSTLVAAPEQLLILKA